MKDCTATPQTSAVAATSSTPRVLPGEQEALFREVLLLLEEAGCPYTVAGAFALRQHTGIARCPHRSDPGAVTGQQCVDRSSALSRGDAIEQLPLGDRDRPAQVRSPESCSLAASCFRRM